MPAPRNRLTVVTDSQPTMDRARVVAVAAANAGWDVTIVAVSAYGGIHESHLGPIRVVHVPVERHLRNRSEIHRVRRLITQFRLPNDDALAQLNAVHGAWSRRLTARAGRLRHRARATGWPVAALARAWALLLLAYVKAGSFAHRVRRYAYYWEKRHARPDRRWRGKRPELLDTDLALGPAIERTQPDVIHAVGAGVVLAAAHAAARIRSSGQRVCWLYEATDAASEAAPEAAEADATVTGPSDLTGLVRRFSELSGPTPAVSPLALDWDVPQRPGPPGRPEPETPPGRTWRPLADSGIRLGLGPTNYAGQAAAFAAAVCRNRPDVSAEVTMYWQPGMFGYPADKYIDVLRLGDLEVQIERLQAIIGRCSHLLVDAYKPVFGYLFGTTIAADLPALRQAGVKVAILCHGSEIRHPGRHMKREELSHFRDAPPNAIKVLKNTVETNLRIARDNPLPTFVTTPDLLVDAPWATWAPLVVNVDEWASDAPVMRRERPVVLHAPSARWTKGTDRILPAVQELDRAGLIELKLLENMPWAQVHDLVCTADLVLDQFTTGSYGTIAVEAMAAGRPVVGYISSQVRSVVGPNLPIINARPEQIASVITALVADRDGTAAVGAASAAYAREYHDGRRTAQALDSFLR